MNSITKHLLLLLIATLATIIGGCAQGGYVAGDGTATGGTSQVTVSPPITVNQ